MTCVHLQDFYVWSQIMFSLRLRVSFNRCGCGLMAHFICPFATDIQHLIAKLVKCLSSDTNKWEVDGTWSFSTRLGVGFSFTVSMKSTAACVCREIGSFHFVPPFYSNWVIVSFLLLLFFLKLLQGFPLSPFFFFIAPAWSCYLQ